MPPSRVSQDRTALAVTDSRLAAILARPWPRAFAVLLAGALSAAALPPVGAIPALFGVAVLAWAVRVAPTARGAALAGWLWGFGYHVAGLYWIANALLVDGARHGWLVPFAVAGLPAVFALYVAAAAWAARRLARTGVAAWLALAGCLAAAEWLRGHLFTGFPWNLPAYVWDPVPALLQPAALLGAYGLSLVTLLAAAAPALWLDPATGRRGRLAAAAACLLLLGGLGAWGWARIPAGPAPAVDGVVLRVVQGNVPQRDKWNPTLKPRHVLRYLSLSAAGAAPTVRAAGVAPGAAPTLVVWPETAVAYLIGPETPLTGLAGAVPAGGSLLFGAAREDAEGRVYNSVLALAADGTLRWAYDKAHLVPFGEYVPLRTVLPLDPIVQGSRDFTPGSGPATLDLPGLPPVSPLVCYEAIFPGAVANPARRPGWLLNPTNDAWYGRSSGPYQHLAITRMRAVEEGLPVVRAANTGISFVADPYGRTLARLGLGETGSLDAPLSRALPPTVYSRIGDLGFLLLVGILLAATRIGRIRGDE
ncbi:apolipoprotein N-acyltransferase [Thalassobaculum sp.]|uniref:apolipoprotein N-acyltransferase n=1 Tax=Thalassobaculum sp. TaxID=2022740 RepID=UPI0032EFFFEC